MKTTDKFMLGIVIGVVLLVATAFFVALQRPKVKYLTDSSPSGVAHNYLLAIKKHDYKVAYRFLSANLPNYPVSLDKFIDDVKESNWEFNISESQALKIDSSKIYGNRAEVIVINSDLYDGAPFRSQYEDKFSMDLKRANGKWKIVNSERYWSYKWSRESEVK